MTRLRFAEPIITLLNIEEKHKEHIHIYSLFVCLSISLSIHPSIHLNVDYWMTCRGTAELDSGQWDIVWTHAGSVLSGRVQTHVMRDWWIQMISFRWLNQPTTTNSRAFLLPMLVDRKCLLSCPSYFICALCIKTCRYNANVVYKSDLLKLKLILELVIC